jgi:ElaB/YqjD/DUF883 family membrane-anchored ribosome-binding protein
VAVEREHEAGELRRESAERREAMRRTASALQDRLREKTHRIEEAVDRTRDTLTAVDRAVRRHRHLLAGGAVGLGLYLGLRHGRRRADRDAERSPYRYARVERPQGSVLGSALSAVAGMALRAGASWALQRLGEATEEDAAEDHEPQQVDSGPTP